MNFYNVFLLLIVTHFSCSMKHTPRRQRMKRENSNNQLENWNQLIPLNLKSDDTTNEFLKNYSLRFRKSIIEKIKNKKKAICSLLSRKSDDADICVPLSSSSGLFTDESVQECNDYCSNKNNEFVQALNEKILKLIYHLFCDTSLYNVQLTIINDNIGNCVNLENGNSTKCECKVKFTIDVSQELNNLLNLALKPSTSYQNMRTTEYLLSDQQNYLVAAIISIKGHPRFAQLYIAWLLRNLKKSKESPRPIPQENYQPSAPYPPRNQELYVPYSDPEALNYSNHFNYPSFDCSSFDNSSSDNSPTYHTYHPSTQPSKYKPYFGFRVDDQRRRRNTNNTTYYTSSSYYDTNESDTVTTVQDNDSASVLQDDGGLVEDIDPSFDSMLWNDVFACDCNSDDCDCLSDIFQIFCDTECMFSAFESGCTNIGDCICCLLQALDNSNANFDFNDD